MKVVKLTRECYEEALKLYCECFQKERTCSSLVPLGDILGLYEGDCLIGIAQIDYINNVFEGKKIAIINSFCIKKEFRNQGYGKKFLDNIIDYLKEKKIDLINMTSNQSRTYAHKLYNSCGFEIVDTIFLKKDI